MAGDVHIEGNNNSGTAGENATLDLAVDDHDSGVNMPTDGTLTLWTNNSEEVRIQSDGDVGLGTTDPSNQLTVSGDANVTDNLGTDGADSPSIPLAVGDNDTGLENPSSDELSLTTGGTEHVRVGSDGRVGLGTDSPDRRLDVDGNARIGNSLFVNDDVYANDYYLEDEGEWVSDLTDDMVCEVCIKSVKDDDGDAVDEECSSSDDGSYSSKSTVPDSTVAKGSQIRIQCRKE
ncbi:MAG: hypothetical protein BRC23_02470 [Parcubacteria group bacterium SW_4_49_11]|nr:MAG: hypothetical protein BRC23_02470 [Parcubacteria group bacterium SW_4_49_11]